MTINFTRGGDFAYSVALQMDGKIVAAGAAEVPEAASRWHGTTMTAVSTRASAATAGDD